MSFRQFKTGDRSSRRRRRRFPDNPEDGRRSGDRRRVELRLRLLGVVLRPLDRLLLRQLHLREGPLGDDLLPLVGQREDDDAVLDLDPIVWNSLSPATHPAAALGAHGTDDALDPHLLADVRRASPSARELHGGRVGDARPVLRRGEGGGGVMVARRRRRASCGGGSSYSGSPRSGCGRGTPGGESTVAGLRSGAPLVDEDLDRMDRLEVAAEVGAEAREDAAGVALRRERGRSRSGRGGACGWTPNRRRRSAYRRPSQTTSEEPPDRGLEGRAREPHVGNATPILGPNEADRRAST